MNKDQLINKLQQNPNFLEEEVQYLDLSEVKRGFDKFQKTNEARQADHNAKNKNDVKQSIEKSGVKVPLTADRGFDGIPEVSDGFGRMDIVMSIEKECNLVLENPDSSEDLRKDAFSKLNKISKIPVWYRSYDSTSDRDSGSLFSNFHEGGSDATNEDIANFLFRKIRKYGVLSTDFSDIRKEDIVKLMYTIKDPNDESVVLADKVHKLRHDGIITLVLDRIPHGGIDSYTNWKSRSAADLIEQFNKTNPYGVQLPKDAFKSDGKVEQGVECSDPDGQKYVVYFGSQKVWFKQNIVHYALNKVRDDERKVIAVAYCGTGLAITKGTSDPITAFRHQVAKAIEEWNSHPRIEGNIVDELCFLPQKKHKEDYSVMYDYNSEPIAMRRAKTATILRKRAG